MQSFSISRLRRCKNRTPAQVQPRRQGSHRRPAAATRRHSQGLVAHDTKRAPLQGIRSSSSSRDTNGSRRRPAAATVTRSRRRPPPPPPAWEFTTLPSAESADSEC
ncbi:hypothetical protein CK203_081031 [Vitis vinifera]|uniref:Uncharacterized protein n=1 Tax=Vitis vinifera TaxID=29760 RepID=A0A438DWR8_VITVI|nr:hypothetical protein CK203_081031 [Vitis vinifera]